MDIEWKCIHVDLIQFQIRNPTTTTHLITTTNYKM